MSVLSRLRTHRAALAFIFVTAVLDIVAMGIIIPVLPVLIEDFVGSNARAGIINGVFVALWAGMQFLCSPIIGSLSDQYGRRPVILISCAGLSLDYMLMALAPDLWWLALGRIIAGITSSSFTTVYAYMADITAPEKRARAFGLIWPPRGAWWNGRGDAVTSACPRWTTRWRYLTTQGLRRCKRVWQTGAWRRAH